MQPNKLTVFREALKQASKADVRRLKHERRTVRTLYVEIKAAGYSRVTDSTSSEHGARAKGKGRIVNERFACMCSHYLYDPDFCNVASGWEKVSSRRTCRAADGASGSTRASSLRADSLDNTTEETGHDA